MSVQLKDILSELGTEPVVHDEAMDPEEPASDDTILLSGASLLAQDVPPDVRVLNALTASQLALISRLERVQLRLAHSMADSAGSAALLLQSARALHQVVQTSALLGRRTEASLKAAAALTALHRLNGPPGAGPA